MHSTAIFTTAFMVAAGVNAQSTWTTSSMTTTTLTKTVEKVIATVTTTGNPPAEYGSSSVEAAELYTSVATSSPSISAYPVSSTEAPYSSSVGTLSTIPYGYGNGTAVAPSGTAASTGGQPSQTYIPVTGGANSLVGVDAVALAALAGVVGFALI